MYRDNKKCMDITTNCNTASIHYKIPSISIDKLLQLLFNNFKLPDLFVFPSPVRTMDNVTV